MKITLLAGNPATDFGLELDKVANGDAIVRLRAPWTGPAPAPEVEVKLAQVFTVPPLLLVTEPRGTRLATLAEVRTLAAREVSQQTQQLEAQWQALVNDISTASLHADMSKRFLGLAPFPGGALDYIGAMKLNLNACLLDSSVRLEATVEVAARCSISHGTAAIIARMAWRLSILATSPKPRLSLQIPVPGLRFPDFEFPNFNLSALAIPIAQVSVFDLPTLPGIPLTLTYDNIDVVAPVYTNDGGLTFTVTINAARVEVFGTSCALGDPTLTFDRGAVTIDGFSVVLAPLNWTARPAAPLPAPLDGVSLLPGTGSLRLALEIENGNAALKGVLTQTLTLFPTLQPSKLLTLQLDLPFDDTGFLPNVTINNVSYPRTITLAIDGGTLSLTGLLQNPVLPGNISLNLDLPALPAPQIDVLIDILSAILGALVKGLAGLARIVEEGLRALFSLLRNASTALSKLNISLVLDQRTGHLQQVLVGVRRGKTGTENIFDTPALSLNAPTDIELALLIDLRDGERDAYLVATVATANKELLTLSSDLWFGGGAKESPAGDITAPGADGAPKETPKLIKIDVKTRENADGRFSFVPFGIRHGQAVFFYALESPLPDFATQPTVAFSGYRLTDKLEHVLKARAKFNPDIVKGRFLPFLAAPADQGEKSGSASGVGDMLKQYIEIETMSDADLAGGVITIASKVTLKAMGSKIRSDLSIELDARRMTANVRGGAIQISLPMDEPLELLGMKATFLNKSDPKIRVIENQFVLDMSGSDTRLYLNDAYIMVLDFDRLGSDADGKPLRFHVNKMIVHGGGLDLEASLAGPYTLRLNGLETDFTFGKAAIRVRSGRIEAFSLGAMGKLPPALLGDVDVKMQLDFGERKDGSVGLLNGAIELQNRGRPIRSEHTHFVLTLDALSMRVFDDGGGLHFCAFISGSAMFKPEAPALAEGMLKKLSGVELKFTDCPVCGASDVIQRELEKLNLSFVIALDEPVKATLFELFTFEVRSFGLEPRCNAFDDRPPAIVIGGQVSFAASGDVVRAECDFHKLYLATPQPGEFLPRLKCEGLGLALRLGSALEIEGKVVAVDGRMPKNMLVSTAPENKIKGNGFMGQGRVAIQGLPPFAASFGFVELEFAGGERKRGWFVYLEAQHLSYYFQLGPVPIYLREAGLGLGFHFTYVGIEAIDNATSLIEMIKGVDKIAATALEPAKLESWTASPRGDLTLVGRLFISMSSASSPAEPLVWKKDEEKDLPNVMLLNVVAAMRKSTFLMTANVWLGYNYYDWDQDRHIGNNELAGKQALTGYVLLAGARSEFLARVKSNPGAKIGNRLALPEQFKNALTEVQYEATLYIRPGLLHFELGWPNRITWSKNFAGVNVSVAGGAIFRVHEGAILVGLNLEGNLNFSLSARLDAGVVGVAVSASVYAALIARIIGFLDSQKVDNSLYYSLFSLQIQVKFEVSAWLEIDAWLCKITIRISFALSLQIDVVAELAMQGDLQMGTRVRATIAISIFGRSLGLSVGLALNPGLVDKASGRVGRFMNMGLMQEVPSVTPDIGQQDSANDTATSIGAERRKARIKAGAANRHGSNLAPVPHEDPVANIAVPEIKLAVAIGPSDFQIVLTYPKVPPAEIDTPLATIDDWVYLTFLPVDAMPVVGIGAQQHSSFYAAPHASDTHNLEPDHIMAFPAAAVDGMQFYAFESNKWKIHSFKDTGADVATKIEWGRKLNYSQRTEDDGKGTLAEKSGEAELTNLFFAAFRTTADRPSEVTVVNNPYEEPNARPPIAAEDRITRLSQTSQQQHDRQERGYNRNMQTDPADRRCHEARDFLMQKFTSDLFQLAADGVVTEQAHVVHVGLTLLVRRELAEALSADGGVRANVQKRIEAVPAGKKSAKCEVFNPPRLMFSKKPPRFDKVVCRFDGNKARLDWDLGWDYRIEPEHFVQHYLLRRWIEVAGDQVGEASCITFKRADHVCEKDDRSRRTVERGTWQYTDEFADMSAGDKAKLFNPTADAVLRYSVVAVCVSGTRSRPCSDFLAVRTGMPQLTAITRASAIMVVNPVPVAATGKLSNPELMLRLESGADSIVAGDQRFWRLLLRSEAIVPAGDYGTDGQTDRPLGGTIGAARTPRRGDVPFKLPAGTNTQFPQATKITGHEDEHASVNKDLPALIELLAETDSPRAYTLLAQSFVQRVVQRDGKDIATEIACSPLVPVELSLIVTSADSEEHKEQNLMTRVDALEMVRLPLSAEEHVLDPVARCDLHAKSGRAAIREPQAGQEDKLDYCSIVHPDFGGVTELSWNVRPSGLAAAALARYRLLAGFEVVSLNLDNGDNAVDPAAWASGRLQRHTLARLLSTEAAPLTPSEVGEPSNWKVRYPSQAARRLAGGAWYSPAESRIDWPWPDIRREPLPEPSSELIKSLLREGVPDYIELAMTGGADISWKFSLPAVVADLWQLDKTATHLRYIGKAGDGAAAALRQALRRLRAEPVGAWPTGAGPTEGYGLLLKSGWALSMTPRWDVASAPGNTDAPVPLREMVTMHFDRDLNPLLEALMARMRRLPASGNCGERLLDVDRRPPPVVQAKSVSAFLDGTSDQLDPYGWAMLDRLGLGVTVRLFDPVADAFLSAHALHAQLAQALKDDTLKGLYPTARAQLLVEVLLQPGGMMEREDFSAVPDGLGEIKIHSEEFLLQTQGLAMLRLSVRPSIKPVLQYVIWDRPACQASDAELTDVDAYVPQLAKVFKFDERSHGKRSLRSFLEELEVGKIEDAAERRRHAQTVILRTRADVTFDVPVEVDIAPGAGELRNGPVDAFGRFGDWNWEYGADPGRHRFGTLLRNALEADSDYKPEPDDDKTITDKWVVLNRRFFAYAADPGSSEKAVVPLAFAAIEPSEPIQIAADSAGRLAVMLPEADGYARTRALAVLPQWRYGRMLRDAGYGAKLDALLKSKREDCIIDETTAKQNRYVLSTIERSAPIQPPEVLAVGRLGDTIWWTDGTTWEQEGAPRSATALREAQFVRAGTDPGNALPIIVRHHPELRLSKSNAMLARALSMAGSLTSFVLTPADQAWCKQFVSLDRLEPAHQPKQPNAGEVDVGLLDQVTQLLGEPPVDSKVRVLRHLPHWYRHSVTLSAGAGSEVATTVSAYLAEAPARLVEMREGIPKLEAGHPWQAMLVPDSINPMKVTMTVKPAYPHFALVLPVLRYCDTTDETTASLWPGAIAELPDPGVIYDLLLEAAPEPLRPRAALTPLARIGRAPVQKGHPYVSTFLLSRDWAVDAALVPSVAGHQLQLSISPMSVPIQVSAELKTLLGSDDYLRGDTMRLPGGWSAGWIDHYVARLADQSVAAGIEGTARLLTALAEADIGLPAGPAELAKLFPSYGLASVHLVLPVDNAGWNVLALVLGNWVAALAQQPGALASLLHDYFAPVATAVAVQTWPTDDPSGKPIPWLDSLPEPGLGCGWTQEAATRMLLPELMTDAEYDDIVVAIVGGAPQLAQRFRLLRASQRERALGGGKLRIRATRGDAIALELALVSLT